MRHLITIGIFLLIAFSANAQLNDADAFMNGSYDKAFIKKHKIKGVSVDIFIDGKKSTFYFFSFDKNGLLKKQTILDSLRKNVNDYIFKYNQYKDQTEIMTIDYDLNKTYKETFQNSYNNSHLIIKKSNELPYRTEENSYNLKGQKIQTKIIQGSDTLNSTKQVLNYTYNKAGKLQSIKKSIINLNSSTDITGTVLFCYGKNGKIDSIKRNDAPTYYINYNKNGFIKSKKIKLSEDLDGIEMVDKYNYSFWK